MRSIILAVVLSLCLAPSLRARTWNILEDGSGGAPTVQAGIDSAAAGDTVRVGPGTYPGQLTFRGRDIVLQSTGGPSQTILDGTGIGQAVVTFSLGESRSAILRGFTVAHGRGGILILNAQPSILDNVITGNGVPQDGGGIWCDAGTFYP